jgi:hypothetical protein
MLQLHDHSREPQRAMKKLTLRQTQVSLDVRDKHLLGGAKTPLLERIVIKEEREKPDGGRSRLKGSLLCAD